MKPHISIITLGVNDLKKATDFYQNGMELPLAAHSNEHVSFFELSGAWLGLFPREELAKDAAVSFQGSGFSGFSIAHNLPGKEQVDQCIQQAIDAGATITKPAADTFWGGYSGYFADLDGYLWEIAWNPHF